MTKADESQQERYKGGVVPMEDIEKHAPEVRTAQPQITDAQAELVHVILHDGCNPTEAAERLGRNKAWRTIRYENSMLSNTDNSWLC